MLAERLFSLCFSMGNVSIFVDFPYTVFIFIHFSEPNKYYGSSRLLTCTHSYLIKFYHVIFSCINS